MAQPQTLDYATLEAAARWYVDLRCAAPDEALHEAHRRWLAHDPRHVLAWERMGRLQSTFDQAPAGLARPALNGARAKRREVLKLLSLLLAGGCVSTLAWRTTPLPTLIADQRTATGERRRLRLDDGSQLQLNTATALNIRYSASLRELQLLSGEILIETARDALARPFVVHTAQGSVRALGTRFIVRSEGGTSSVSVQQHAVEVRPADLSGAVLRVEAGQQLSFADDHLGTLQPAAPYADAWTRDMLLVSDRSLGEFIAELQRYRPGHLGCDPAVAALRISGAFQLGDLDAVLDNLTTTLPVRISRFSRYWTQVEPA